MQQEDTLPEHMFYSDSAVIRSCPCSKLLPTYSISCASSLICT